MSNDNIDNSAPNDNNNNNEVVADAITGATKKPQYNLSSLQINVKEGVQEFKLITGLKSDGEAVNAIIGAILGYIPSVHESAESIGDKLAANELILKFAEQIKDNRSEVKKDNKLANQIRKLKEMGITPDQLAAMMKA